jgi:hypothetical protein
MTAAAGACPYANVCVRASTLRNPLLGWNRFVQCAPYNQRLDQQEAGRLSFGRLKTQEQ